jgi:D-alanyl-D-alanine carboxypeptidase
MRFGERLLRGLLWLVVLACVTPPPAVARVPAEILVDVASGTVLAARNADERVAPASLTKMMTLYLTFRAIEAGQLKLTSKLKVSRRAAAMPPTKLGLKAGSTIEVEDAILGLVTRSANDAASVLAEALGGTEDRFASVMTRHARRLGMTRTVFRNASGLPDGAQRSTARDLSRLAMRLIADYPDHYRYFSRRSFAYAGRTHGNHNRLLASYAGMDGLKTGYTRASGFNLAASAVRDGRRLVGVVIGGATAASRDARMVDMLDEGFAKAGRRRVDVPVAAALSVTEPAATALVVPDRVRQDEVEVASLDPAAAVAAVAIPSVRPKSAEVERAVTRPSKSAKATSRAAKTKSAAKKRKPAQPYGVQVGAFQKSKQARAALELAMRRVPDLLRGTMVSVGSTQGRSGTLFRATLVGLSKADADTVCRRLKKKRHDCLVVRTSSLEVATR